MACLEALVTSQYDSEAIALTDISVCRIPLEVVHKLAANSQRLHLKLMQKWQQTLKDADDWLADLNFGTAKQRVSNLILKMRSTTDGKTVSLFSRDDMGAMLDLKLETVSREISKLVKDAAIEPLDKTGRVYRILQLHKLETT